MKWHLTDDSFNNMSEQTFCIISEREKISESVENRTRQMRIKCVSETPTRYHAVRRYRMEL